MHTYAESCTLPVDADSLAIAEALAARLSLSPSAVVRLALSLLAEREDLELSPAPSEPVDPARAEVAAAMAGVPLPRPTREQE
jgi:hypothetical protein